MFEALVGQGQGRPARRAALPAVAPTPSPGRCACWTRSPTEDEEMAAIEEVLARHEPGYERDPTKKIQLLSHLGHLKHDKAAALVAPYLKDMDEGVRFTAAEALLRHKREDVAREPLLELFISDAEESLRIRLRICEGFADLGWLVHGHRGGRGEEAARRLPAGPRRSHQEAAPGLRHRLAPHAAPQVRNASAKTRRHQERAAHRLGPHRHRPGLRVRLLRHPGRCKALKEEGFRVVLVNSNPATIMTDPELADRTYVEPLTVEIVEKIIARERPDALLPTLGGQTALNLTIELAKAGVLDKYGVKLIGAQLAGHREGRGPRAVQAGHAEDRPAACPLSGYARSLEEGHRIQKEIAAACGQGFPVILRPSFTLGGSGAAVAWNAEEFDSQAAVGPAAEPARRGAGRAVGAGLEGIRAGDHARPQRQRGHRLLDRELRSDGHPHRRLHHHRPGHDPDRQGVPGHARRRHRGDPRDRRRDRRLEHPVRGQPARPAT